MKTTSDRGTVTLLQNFYDFSPDDFRHTQNR